MTPRRNVLRIALALVAATLLAACESVPSSQTVANHVAAANQAAGSEFEALTSLCEPPPVVPPPRELLDAMLKVQIGRPAPPPGRAFDNLYFVGAAWVSAWAIATSDGIILIDALNNQAEAASVIETGLAELGLDPARIKYVIVTHAHGDHYGGAAYLAAKYNARVVMSAPDWLMTETQLEYESALWSAPPKRDLVAADGQTITLGDTTVLLRITPGHTPGTISPTFDVRADGQTHRVLLWGGTSFDFGKDIARLGSYIDSAERLKRAAQAEHIDVLISNHAGVDGTLDKLATLRNRTGGDANPFVLGTPRVVRALTVMQECARAQRDRFRIQP